MLTVRGWSTAYLIGRERVFDALIGKAVKMSLRTVSAHLDRVIVAAAEVPSLSQTAATAGPVLTMTDAGTVTATWDNYVAKELFPYLTQTFLDSASDVFGALEEHHDLPKVTDSLAQDYLADAANRLKNLGDLVWFAMRAELLDGVAAGEDMRQLATRVRNVSNVTAARATVIARTEVHNAAEAGSLMQVQLGGFTDAECSKRWLATEDERTRVAHVEADGQMVGLNQPFIVGGEGLQRPGDPNGRADNVIQCRCTMEFIFDGVDDNDDEPITSAFWRKRDHPHDPVNGRFVEKGTGVVESLGTSSIDVTPLASTRARGKDLLTSDDAIVALSRELIGVDKPLVELARRQGFHNHPQVGNAAQLAAQIKAGWREIHRGDHKAEVRKKFTDGAYEPGDGQFGQGFYFTESKKKARGYATDLDTGVEIGVQTHAALTADANVAHEGPFRFEHRQFIEKMEGKLTPEELAVWKDPGVFGTAKGYDALLHIPPELPDDWTTRPPKDFLVFNRSALFVQDDIDVLTADAAFEAQHPRAEDGRFGKKPKFHVLPKELRGKSGDGRYKKDVSGIWGKYGAAGVMMRHVDDQGVARYMVVQRTAGGSGGWRWQLPGGALEELETPAQGAAREAMEELGATEDFLAKLQPRGEHVAELPVEGMDPWKYTSLTADAPYMFKPKIDFKELGAARWLTEEQLREMMTRGRLVAPFHANFDKILAGFNEPVTAAAKKISKKVVPDGDWDAAEHPRSKSDGKFIKKGASAGVAADISPADKVAQLSEQIKKKQQAVDVAYLGGDDYLTSMMQLELDVLKDQLDEAVKSAFTPTPKMKTAPKSTPTISQLPKPAATTPITAWTTTIYKTSYAPGTVVATKEMQDGKPAKAIVADVDAKGKPVFLYQEQDLAGLWKTKETLGKGAIYKKVKDDTGWYEGNGAPTFFTPQATDDKPSTKPLDFTSLNADVEYMDAATFSGWFFDNFVDVNIGNLGAGAKNWLSLTPEQREKIKNKAFKIMAEDFYQPFAEIKTLESDAKLYAPQSSLSAGIDQLTDMPPSKVFEWIKTEFPDTGPESVAKWQSLSDDEKTDLKQWGAYTSLKGFGDTVLEAIEAKAENQPEPILVLPDFDNMNILEINDWYTALTPAMYHTLDDYDKQILWEDAKEHAALNGNLKPLAAVKAIDPKFSNPGSLGVTQLPAFGKMSNAEVAAWIENLSQDEFGNLSDIDVLKLDDISYDLLSFSPTVYAKVLTLKANQIKIEEGNDLGTSNLVDTPKISDLSTPPAVAVANVDPKTQLHIDAIDAVNKTKLSQPSVGETDFHAVTPNKMTKIQDDMFTASGKTWSSSQKAAINTYTTKDGYQSVNGVLRNDKTRMNKYSEAQLKDAAKRAELMQSAMLPLPVNLKLFRGTGAQAFGFGTDKVSFAKLKKLEGATLKDNGFFSTTVVEKPDVTYDYANKKQIRVVVNAPKGTPGLWVSSATSWQSENEFLLAAGTNYRIDSVVAATDSDKASYGSSLEHIVTVTVIPGDPPQPKLTDSASTPATPGGVTTPTPAPSVTPAVTPTPTISVPPPTIKYYQQKINTTVVHTTKWKHGQIVGVRKFGSPGQLQRVLWDADSKKFVLQVANEDGTGWKLKQSFSKKAFYDTYHGEVWWTPQVGVTTNGFATSPDLNPSPLFSDPETGFGTKVATSAPSVTAPVVPTVAEIKKQSGVLPTTLTVEDFSAAYEKFKTNSGYGKVFNSSNPEKKFKALVEAVKSWNASASSDKKLNYLQMLNIIDIKEAEVAGTGVNLNLYQKSIIAWLQTSEGKNNAPGILNTILSAPASSIPGVSPPSAQMVKFLQEFKEASDIGVPSTTDKKFPLFDITQAKAMHDEMMEKYGKWTAAQKSGLAKYKASSGAINGFLRGWQKTGTPNNGTSEYTLTDTINVQDAMRPATRSFLVHRGTDGLGTALNAMTLQSQGAQKFVGAKIKSKAFLSTSVGGTPAMSGHFTLEIEVPKGTPVAFTYAVNSAHQAEQEMTLAAGLTYEIISINSKPGGYGSVVRMRAVPDVTE